MQQFRPLPKFDEIDKAVPVEPSVLPTTDPMPVFHGIPTLPADSLLVTGTMPVVLLSGPRPTADTVQLAAFVQRDSASTDAHSSLASALQMSMQKPVGTTGRHFVIHAEPKYKKVGKPERLNAHLRQTAVLITTLVILVATLTTLVPLSDNQNGSLFSNLGNWIHSVQLDWQIQAHLSNGSSAAGPTYLNGPGLPYMTIANSPYVSIAELDASNAGIPPTYFVRQIQQESGFNTRAVSVTNAEGIAQFEPSTASGLGIDPWDPVQSLRAAAHLMAGYYHQYGNYAKALGAYNAGPGTVQSASYACGASWLSCMPAQSQGYVFRIMGV